MVNKVWIKGFRNLVEQVVTLHPRVTVVLGPNNQGKTNFLEAVYFLMTGKSPAKAQSDMMVSILLPKAQLGLSVVGFGEDKKLYIDLLRDGTKRIQWDGEFVKTHRTVMGVLAVQYWSADVLWLFQESPSFRRDFLDLFCERYFAEFSGFDRRYQSILKQKNSLLGMMSVDMKMLELLNQQLAQVGSELVRFRNLAIGMMMEKVTPYLASYFPNQGDDICVEYAFSGFLNGVSVDEYGAKLLQLLTEKCSKEVMVRQSLYGPHRDDFVVKVGDMPMVGYYSRGMTRIFALLMTFSQLLLLGSDQKRVSVLLLDDAFAELDLAKKKALMSDFSEYAQVVYTTVLEEDRELSDDLSLYRVAAGRIELCG